MFRTGDRATPSTTPSAGPSSSAGRSAPVDPNATTTIPDLGDVTGPVGDCVKLAAKFSNLVQGVLEGADGARRSQQSAEQMKAVTAGLNLPPGFNLPS